MSIYIEGMEMPKDGMKNIMILADGRVFQFSGYGIPKPLGAAISVPPHGRLGDLDALADSFEPSDFWSHDAHENCYAAVHIVHSAPTIIPASCENPAKSRDNHDIDEEEEGE